MSNRSYSQVVNLIDTKTDEISGTLEFGVVSASVGSFTQLDVNGSPVLTQNDAIENYVINGDFSINQRGFISQVVPSAGTTTLDCWTTTTPSASIFINQNGTITLDGSIAQYINLSNADQDYILDADVLDGSLIAEISSSTQTVSGSLPLEVNINTGYWILLVLTGTNCNFTNVRFGPGNQNSIFRKRRYEDELKLCRRHYMKEQAPQYTMTHVVDYYKTAVNISFPESMWESPEVTLYNVVLNFPQSSARTFNGVYSVYSTESMFAAQLDFSNGSGYGNIAGYINMLWEADATVKSITKFSGFTDKNEEMVIINRATQL